MSFELETRNREAQTLRQELEFLQSNLDLQQSRHKSLDAEVEAVSRTGMVKERDLRLHWRHSSRLWTEKLSSNPLLIRNQETESAIGCLNQRILSRLSAHSSSLSDAAGRFSHEEMGRIRMLDCVMEELERRLTDGRTLSGETSNLTTQLSAIRGEYDSALLDDFIVLVDLSTSVEHLEADVVGEKRCQKRDMSKLVSRRNSRAVIPINESTIQLQAELSSLSSHLESLENTYKNELDKEHAQLSRLKSKKAKAKSEFQQSLKSVFKDFDVLLERLTRSEGILEKMNSHYQITEEEIVTIVSPILETIDGAKERIQHLSTDAEAALYGGVGMDDSIRS
jgi:hypothetical protein